MPTVHGRRLSSDLRPAGLSYAKTAASTTAEDVHVPDDLHHAMRRHRLRHSFGSRGCDVQGVRGTVQCGSEHRVQRRHRLCRDVEMRQGLLRQQALRTCAKTFRSASRALRRGSSQMTGSAWSIVARVRRRRSSRV
jgi:hypothetical protein